MTVRMAGLSTMVDAQEFNELPTNEDRKTYMRDLIAQMEPQLRTHIGDVRPEGQPVVSVDGPVPDPSASKLLVAKPRMVYVVTYACPVDDAKLPADCTAYTALGS